MALTIEERRKLEADLKECLSIIAEMKRLSKGIEYLQSGIERWQAFADTLKDRLKNG